ncbi:MAG: hypothetical protein HY330_06885 [Chloroflexi bacterium]|nr:hypothetical protein [Chloroflexota bacterium]
MFPLRPLVSSLCVLSLAATACGGGYGAAPPATSAPPAATAAPTATRAPTPTSPPTATVAMALGGPTAAPTPAPTATARPSPALTPAATATSAPAATPTPGGATPAPSGTGDYDYGPAEGSATPTPGAAPPAGHDVEISFQEWSVGISGMAHAGQVKLLIRNQGRFPHSFAINAGGQVRQLGSNVAAGGSGELTLALAAGEYTLWCPLPGHRERGLEAKLQVQ